MLKIGDIGFSSNISKGPSGLLAMFIRFFTKSQFSHTLMITDDVEGIEAVEEASKIVQVVPFDKNYRRNPTEIYKMFRPNAPTQVKIKAAKECFAEFSGDKYGKLQLIWFVYRCFMERVPKKDVRHQKNWMTDGVICSELVYHYLCKLGEPYKTLLAPWNPDTIQAEDIHSIVQAHPELFEIVEVKGF